jgi:hypothetical protein
MSAMPVAAILGTADVNDARGYYHPWLLWNSLRLLLCSFVVLLQTSTVAMDRKHCGHGNPACRYYCGL